jgi:hypothetical protein
MDTPETCRVDRSALEIRSTSDRLSDRDYWLSKTVEERLEALELLRQIAYGYDPNTERLQRVLEVAEFKPR